MDYCIHCMEPLGGAEVCPACGKIQAYPCPEHHLRPGTLLSGRYQLGTALGAGGFGITYIARDTRLKMTVAVKEFYPVGYVTRSAASTAGVTATTQGGDFFARGREKFLSEAIILASLHDEPGIVDVRDFFEENNTAYIVMEYLRGETLKAYLYKQGRLPLRQAYVLLRPVMDSLAAAHEKNVIHRDIAPDNIMLTRRGAKLLDFGAAREVFSEDERSLSIMVKRGYSPYEQYTKKNQGPWTDVYALCAVLYRTVTGRAPEDALERMRAPETAPSFDDAIPDGPARAALTRGLSVFPEQRFRSMAELLHALDAAISAPEQFGPVVREERTVAAVEQTRRAVPPAPVSQPISQPISRPHPVQKPQQIDHTRATEAVWHSSAAASQPASSQRRPVSQAKSAEPGRTVFFGAYPQSGSRNAMPQPIEWYVLARDGRWSLLVSKYALDCCQFHSKYKKVTWDLCSLRMWLNGTFLNRAFSFQEQSRIQTTMVPAERNPDYPRVNPGDATQDKVFLLSLQEATRYFSSGEMRKCIPTPYAVSQGVWTSMFSKTGGHPTSWWLLRTPGSSQHYVTGVRTTGTISADGSSVDSHDGAVRPAIWVALDA